MGFSVGTPELISNGSALPQCGRREKFRNDGDFQGSAWRKPGISYLNR